MGGKLKLAYLGIFVLFLAILPAQALTESFSLTTTSKEISACACGIFSNGMTLRNTGDVPSTYTITQDGTAISWSNIVPNMFSLEPNKAQEISDYFKIPCDATGSYSLVTKAETQFGTAKVLQQTIDVNRCTNVQVIIKRIDPDSMCACTPVTYSADIKNIGSFEDTFAFKTNKEGIRLSDESLILQAGQTKTIYLYANLPCDVYGSQDFTLSVKAQNSGYSDDTIVPLNIKSCYKYEVSAPKEVTLCNAEKKVFPVTIFNLDELSNTYTLSVDDRAAFEGGSKLFLWAHTNGTAPLTVREQRPGKYNITIDAESERGDVSKTGVVQLNVNNCNSADISISKRQDSIVSCDDLQYVVALKNDGTVQNSYNIVMSSPSWASLLVASSPVLQPGTEQTIPLNVKVPCDFAGNAKIRVNATVSGKNIVDSSVLDLKVYSKEDAYRLDIDVKPTAVYYKGESIPITISHSGIRHATYQLSVNGPSWIRLDKQTITLAPESSTVVYLKTNPSKSTKEDTYRIEVSAAPVGQNMAFAKVFDLPLRTAPIYKKIFDKLNKYKLYILEGIGALLALLIILYLIRRFSRYVKRKREERALRPVPPLPPLSLHPASPKKKRWPWVILWILLISALLFSGLATYYYFTQYKQPVSSLITIDRNGLPGIGNTILIKGFDKVRIGLILHNPFEETLSYNLQIENAPWMKADRSFVQIPPKGTERINLDISPDKNIPDGQYKLRISARLPKDNKIYTESLNVVLWRFGSSYKKYLPYAIAGVAILGALLLLMGLLKKRKTSPDAFLGQLDKTANYVPKEFALHERRSWKWLWILLGILLILGAVGGAVYLAGQLPGFVPGAKPTDNKSLIAINQTGIKGVEVQGSLVIIRGTQNVTIPIILQNSDEGRAIYDISFASVPWLKVDKTHVELDELESEAVNLFISPSKAAGQRFEIKIGTRLVDQNLVYNEAITLDIRAEGVRSLLQTLRTYWKYMAAAFGLLLLIALVSWIVKRRRKTAVKQMIGEFVQESKGRTLHDLKSVHSPKKAPKSQTKLSLRQR